VAARSTALVATEEEPGLPPLEVELWLRVIEQALIDSVCTNRHNPYFRRTARLWLSEYSPDLGEVLGHVGIDAGWWMSRVVPELRRQWSAVDASPLPRRRGGPRRSLHTPAKQNAEMR
jgi:hypothetical protein